MQLTPFYDTKGVYFGMGCHTKFVEIGSSLLPTQARLQIYDRVLGNSNVGVGGWRIVPTSPPPKYGSNPFRVHTCGPIIKIDVGRKWAA